MTPTFRILYKAAATQPEPKSFLGIEDDGLLGTAMDFIPGVSTVYSGGKALRDFSQGNIWGGLGNSAFALAGLIPGAGAVAKGLGRAGKYLSKATGFGRMGRSALAATNNVARAAQRTHAGGRQLFNANLGKGMGWNGGQGFNAGLRTGQLKTTGALMAGATGAGMLEGSPAVAAPVQQQPLAPWSPDQNPLLMGMQPGSAAAMGGQWMQQAYPQQTKLAAWRMLSAL